MSDKAKRINYHYGFYAAMKVEYDLRHADVEYDQEVQLGEEPVRLDFLIMKKNTDEKFSDPIGSFFRKYNLFEYKSPEDGLTIDDFCKALGYALIFKGYDRKADEIPLDELTLTIVRHPFPKELFAKLMHYGYEITEQYRGIYSVKGTVGITIQIICTSQLEGAYYPGLKLLVKGNVAKEDVYEYIGTAMRSGDPYIKANVGTVVGICLNANIELAKQIKEDGTMGEAIKEIWKDEFDAAEERGMARGLERGMEKGLERGMEKGLERGIEKGIEKGKETMITEMLKSNVPPSNIAKWSGMPLEKIAGIARNIGIDPVLP